MFHPRWEIYFCIHKRKDFSELGVQRMRACGMVTAFVPHSPQGSPFNYWIGVGVWIHQNDPTTGQTSSMEELQYEGPLFPPIFPIDKDLKRKMLQQLYWSMDQPVNLEDGSRSVTRLEIMGCVEFITNVFEADDPIVEFRQFSLVPLL